MKAMLIWGFYQGIVQLQIIVEKISLIFISAIVYNLYMLHCVRVLDISRLYPSQPIKVNKLFCSLFVDPMVN